MIELAVVRPTNPLLKVPKCHNLVFQKPSKFSLKNSKDYVWMSNFLMKKTISSTLMPLLWKLKKKNDKSILLFVTLQVRANTKKKSQCPTTAIMTLMKTLNKEEWKYV